MSTKPSVYQIRFCWRTTIRTLSTQQRARVSVAEFDGQQVLKVEYEAPTRRSAGLP